MFIAISIISVFINTFSRINVLLFLYILHVWVLFYCLFTIHKYIFLMPFTNYIVVYWNISNLFLYWNFSYIPVHTSSTLFQQWFLCFWIVLVKGSFYPHNTYIVVSRTYKSTWKYIGQEHFLIRLEFQFEVIKLLILTSMRTQYHHVAF